ncbi:MAG: PH domain-containing protein, partial [Frankiales bacterium]
VMGEKLVPWQVVRAVRLDDGSPWASLDLQDDDTLALFAIQSNDGDRAVEAVLGLRALLAASREGPRT